MRSLPVNFNCPIFQWRKAAPPFNNRTVYTGTYFNSMLICDKCTRQYWKCHCLRPLDSLLTISSNLLCVHYSGIELRWLIFLFSGGQIYCQLNFLANISLYV